jgi:hypothetical protein
LPDSSSPAVDAQESATPDKTQNVNSSPGQFELPQNNEPKKENQSSSNIGIIIGALLGAALLIFSLVSYYWVKKRPSGDSDLNKIDSDVNQLDLRYSLENSTPETPKKVIYDTSIGSYQNHLIGISEHNELDFSGISEHNELDLRSCLNYTTGVTTPEEASEALDIARSAQNAAQISGYLTKNYLPHDSVVSYDSFA